MLVSLFMPNNKWLVTIYTDTNYKEARRKKSKFSGKHSTNQRRDSFFFLQAKAENFRNIKYIAKRKFEFQSILTLLDDGSKASFLPVGFIFAPFSLFFVV